MATVVHLKLTGKAEAFLKKMKDEGLSEHDVFAKALTLLEDVYRTKRVVRIKEEFRGVYIEAVEFYYGINVHENKEEVVASITEAVPNQLRPDAERGEITSYREGK
jgi:hypothetical protein